MSQDRFVYWQSAERPTRAQLRLVLQDYLGGAGRVCWKHDRFYVVLPGLRSETCRRVSTVSKAMRAFAKDTWLASKKERERWIEVYMHEDCLDIITRMADDFTNGLAQRLAECCARYWNGKLEVG